MSKYSIVIPLYNSSKILPDLYKRVLEVMESLKVEFELILVNDASSDNSWEVMKLLREKDKRVKIISFTRNFGQHPALLCGMKYASGDYVITMDDDLQHPPEEIPKLIKVLDENKEVDVVIGKYITKNHSVLRNFGTYVINLATTQIFEKNKDLKLTSFRALRLSVVKDILKHHTESPRVGQILLMVTNRIVNVEVVHNPRVVGKSGYSFSRLVKDFMDNIMGNSSLPLKFVTYLGGISFLLSLLLIIYYMFKYFFVGTSVQGWTTVIIFQLLFFGLFFLSLGIIGEYLIRILKESKKLPQYIERDVEV